jgi:hypothetical protein
MLGSVLECGGDKEGLMKKTKKAKATPRKAGKAQASKSGAAYHHGEVALAYLVKKSPQAMEKLAKLLGRTPGAVDQLWSWWEGAEVPSSALQKQMGQVKELFGCDLHSSVAFASPVASPAPFASVSSCCQSSHDPFHPITSFDHEV